MHRLARLSFVALIGLLGCASRPAAPAQAPQDAQTPQVADPSHAARPDPARSAAPTPTASKPAPKRRQGEVERAPPGPYDRGAWTHWTDDDGDCQDTRTEVLIAESEIAVTLDASGCKVLRGRWTCPYTLQVFEDPRKLDVDHLVPLRHAHDHGAAAWASGRRRDYANDLEHPEHLVAVAAGANRSKGAKGLEAWLPEAPQMRCAYVGQWMDVKRVWGLQIDAAEADLAVRYAALCAKGEVPPLPQETRDLDEALGEEKGCCRVCRKGKPCGDACISRNKTCSVAPGCACAAVP